MGQICFNISTKHHGLPTENLRVFMKISILTATYNAESTLSDNLRSVQAQIGDFELEQIVQDGGSTDRTVEVVRSQSLVVSEKELQPADGELKSEAERVRPRPYLLRLESRSDEGFYDAINQAFERSKGDIIGLLNADDFYASEDVLDTVVKAFEDNPNVMVVYGDLDYVTLREPQGRSGKLGVPGFWSLVSSLLSLVSCQEDSVSRPVTGADDLQSSIGHFPLVERRFRIIRRWRSGASTLAKWKNGWMPPHPTVFVCRKVYEKYGGYRLDMGTAADYQWMHWILAKHRLPSIHLHRVMVKMRVGGISNANTKARLNANIMDRKAWELAGMKPNPWFRFSKPLRKLPQWIVR